MNSLNKHSKQSIHFAPANILSCRQRKVERNVDSRGSVSSEGVTTRDVLTLKNELGYFNYRRAQNGTIRKMIYD